jgi:hypothetical protein
MSHDCPWGVGRSSTYTPISAAFGAVTNRVQDAIAAPLYERGVISAVLH